MYDVQMDTVLNRCETCDKEFNESLKESRPELFTKRGQPRSAKWETFRDLERERSNVLVPCVVFVNYDDTWGYDHTLVVCKRHFKELSEYFLDKLDSLET